MEFWYLWVIFALLCALTVFVSVMAGRAVKRHGRETRQIIDELKRLKALKERFSSFDERTARDTDARTLLDGVYAVIEAGLACAKDAEAAFAALSEQQRYVYALKCLLEDCGGEGLSPFFQKNERLLTSLAAPALSSVGEPKLSAAAQKLFEAFESGSEGFEEKAAEADGIFVSAFDPEEFAGKVKEYIIKNRDVFQ